MELDRAVTPIKTAPRKTYPPARPKKSPTRKLEQPRFLMSEISPLALENQQPITSSYHYFS